MTVDVNGFDREYYLAQNSDVRAAGVDPYQHYLRDGWREGRDPNAFFDVSYYLSRNPDVANAGVEPLKHYVDWGRREDRDPSAAFDQSRYLQVYTDVAAAGVNPLFHYLNDGMREGRTAFAAPAGTLTDGFDREFYLERYTDVAATGEDPFRHYQVYGRAEGRAPNAFFDPAFYLNLYPDVRAGGLDPFEHFTLFGEAEGRRPSAAFDLATYESVFGTSGNAVVNYLTTQRNDGIVFDGNQQPILQGSATLTTLAPTLLGPVTLTLQGGQISFAATSSPLNGKTASGFATYDFSESIGTFTIAGTGALPSQLKFGFGSYGLTGTYDQGGAFSTIVANAGFFDMNATVQGGGLLIQTGAGGSRISLAGSAGLTLIGGNGADEVHASFNNDSLAGGRGANIIDGGLGADTARWDFAAGLVVDADLVRGTGVDRSAAGLFSDQLIAIEGLTGGAGGDRLAGDAGVNLLAGNDGADLILGRGGADGLLGGAGDDILLGGDGADVLSGGLGNDLLVDTAANATAGATVSSIDGNDGNDTLVLRFGTVVHAPGAQRTSLSGQSGADLYLFDPDGGTWADAIFTFNAGEGDKIDLSRLRDLGGDFLSFADVSSALSTDGANSTLALNQFRSVEGSSLSGQLVLQGISNPAQLQEADFVLANGLDWKFFIPIQDQNFA